MKIHLNRITYAALYAIHEYSLSNSMFVDHEMFRGIGDDTLMQLIDMGLIYTNNQYLFFSTYLGKALIDLTKDLKGLLSNGTR